MYKKIMQFLVVLLVQAPSAWAAEPYALTIKDHRFTPETLKIPANERVKLEVANNDDTPAEFESSEFRVEKIIVPHGKISVFVGPLKPGSYKFFDEYNPDTARGTLIAEEAK